MQGNAAELRFVNGHHFTAAVDQFKGWAAWLGNIDELFAACLAAQ
jgi:hypothetical protein